MAKRYLVTGGAGYVGSHLVAHLLDAGHDCVVFDNLSTGHRQAVPPGARLIVGDLADAAAIDAALKDGPFDAVFHLASLSLVGESMHEPMRYLSVNPANASRLIDACVRNGVLKLVFSSTCNMFSSTGTPPFDETATIDPGSPYGESKVMVERMLHWAGQIHGLRYASMRYFNAAGADPHGRLGEDHTPETHLIPLTIDAALGRTPGLVVFGTDYPTPDGTCVRDYVHVNDLAQANLLAAEHIGNSSACYNIGTGGGFSVLEVIRAVERVSGRKVPYTVAPRRGGDPPELVASAAKITSETGWAPAFSSIDTIVETALAWRIRNPRGYAA